MFVNRVKREINVLIIRRGKRFVRIFNHIINHIKKRRKCDGIWEKGG